MECMTVQLLNQFNNPVIDALPCDSLDIAVVKAVGNAPMIYTIRMTNDGRLEIEVSGRTIGVFPYNAHTIVVEGSH